MDGTRLASSHGADGARNRWTGGPAAADTSAASGTASVVPSVTCTHSWAYTLHGRPAGSTGPSLPRFANLANLGGPWAAVTGRERAMGDAAADALTVLLARADGGDPTAAAALLPLVYDQLKALARRHMAAERADHTLQPTALVHEAYLRLVGRPVGADGVEVPWANRAQFFAAAAEAMRRILVDHARAKGGLKRGGDRRRLPADVMELTADDRASELLELDEAITRLDAVSPGVGQVVRLRYFAGLSIDETAAVTGVSARTVKRDWTFARAWLSRDLAAYAPR